MSTSHHSTVKEIISNLGIEGFEFIPLKTPLSFPKYADWIDKGYQGAMKYMEDNSQAREKPKDNFKSMQSIIVFRHNYFPHPKKQNFPLKQLKVAHYATGEDYHFWFRDKLKELIHQLSKKFPEEKFLAFTDALPLLERDHAYQAGLGWVGKNTCLIDRKQGSLFFIGEIFSSLPSDNTPDPVPDFCGTCTACIDACPTQAIKEDKVLNASKCISYWNIESKKPAPIELRQHMGDWFFGCDICQTVCPWNMKLHKKNPDYEQKSSEQHLELEEELRMILTSSNKQLMRTFAETPLSRAGGRGLKKNAIMVAANRKLLGLKTEVESYIQDENLKELARWALEQLNSTK